MMIDEITMRTYGGSGGRGVVAFEKAPFNPVGRPIGGSGGKGGSVVVEAILNANDFSKHIRTTTGNRSLEIVARSENGKDGDTKGMTGREGRDKYIYVPIGTCVYGIKSKTDELQISREMIMLQELSVIGDKYVIVQGGRGGRGNRTFVNSKNRSPLLAEMGARGEYKRIFLSLKIHSDIALIGMPNSGKSSLLSALTGIKTKIASYPFTTTSPLRASLADQIHRFDVLELPALTDESNQSKGLGNAFLRHLQNTKLIVLVVSDALEYDLANQAQILMAQLRYFNPDLIQKQKLCVVNSQLDNEIATDMLTDIVDGECISLNFSDMKAVAKLKQNLVRIAKNISTDIKAELTNDELPVIKPLENEKSSLVEVVDGHFQIVHSGAMLLAEGSDLNNNQALLQYRGKLDDFGVVRALEEQGIKLGDIVKVGSWEFEWT